MDMDMYSMWILIWISICLHIKQVCFCMFRHVNFFSHIKLTDNDWCLDFWILKVPWNWSCDQVRPEHPWHHRCDDRISQTNGVHRHPLSHARRAREYIEDGDIMRYMEYVNAYFCISITRIDMYNHVHKYKTRTVSQLSLDQLYPIMAISFKAEEWFVAARKSQNPAKLRNTMNLPSTSQKPPQPVHLEVLGDGFAECPTRIKPSRWNVLQHPARLLTPLGWSVPACHACQFPSSFYSLSQFTAKPTKRWRLIPHHLLIRSWSTKFHPLNLPRIQWQKKVVVGSNWRSSPAQKPRS